MLNAHARQSVRAAQQSACIDRCIAAGASQGELADLCAVSEGTVSKWRSGELTMGIDHIRALVAAFGLTVLGVEPRLMPCEPREELIGVAAMAADAAVRFADADEGDRLAVIRAMIARLADAESAVRGRV